jgi:hypothetical protein
MRFFNVPSVRLMKLLAICGKLNGSNVAAKAMSVAPKQWSAKLIEICRAADAGTETGIAAVAEAADATTGGVGSDNERTSLWDDWWDYGDRILGDMDRWGRSYARDGRDYHQGIDDGFREFENHLHRPGRDWDDWRRYQPMFDDWRRRWGNMRNRWGGRDWRTGDWRTHEPHFRGLMSDFDSFYGHWNRMRRGGGAYAVTPQGMVRAGY